MRKTRGTCGSVVEGRAAPCAEGSAVYHSRDALSCSGRCCAVAVVTATPAAETRLDGSDEYEEQIYLRVDGSATVVIDASIPALVALRNLPLDPSRASRIDRDELRTLFASQGCVDPRVGQPWVRKGRRFVQVDLSVGDVRELTKCAPLAWSSYSFERSSTDIHFVQRMGAAANGAPGNVNWDGSELVGFKLHAPSRVLYHNVRRLEDNQPGQPDRGNILTWEQRLSDRQAGQPLVMDVRLAPESILYRTLWLFAGAFAAAVAVIGALIWAMVDRGRRAQRGEGERAEVRGEEALRFSAAD